MDKKEIRKEIKRLRLSLDNEQKEMFADQVFTQLEELQEFKQADHIMFYHSLPDELPTLRYLNKWSTSKHLYLPRVNGEELDILPYSEDSLDSGAFDIIEPTGQDLVDDSKIELVIVPAVAFDKSKNRLGRGKGFYDRLLKKACNAKTIGVGYDFQLMESLPVEPHDVPMEIVVTPSNVIR
ncbi:MAG: 5-formyltetrahydrofolate cyclo-ligase [Muribaculaceae bacterium]|nr:5-formyltetrahydrofolate cyclo-ligase [Muribaculaceae bacterium]